MFKKSVGDIFQFLIVDNCGKIRFKEAVCETQIIFRVSKDEYYTEEQINNYQADQGIKRLGLDIINFK